MTTEELACFMDLLGQAPSGPRIEFGVFRGKTLQLMRHSGLLMGVDSFEGMPQHTERDEKDGWIPYPKGRLASAPPKVPGATLVKGWVPDILKYLPVGPYAFAHLDMDQYDSTLAALEWLYPKMLSGGIIVCDDWFKDRDWLAGGAINLFAERVPMTGYAGRKAWFKIQ